MLQRTDKGKQCRQYFIKVEEQWNSPEAIMSRALKIADMKLLEAQNAVKRLEIKVEQDKPKVIFADAVSASKSSILIGELAKILKQNGVDTGQKRLFQWMRDKGYLMKSGSSRNMPTQRSMDKGLFEIKETTVTHSDGHIAVNKTVKCTGKGQVYFINLLAGEVNSDGNTEKV
jgi:anti-repressor protein